MEFINEEYGNKCNLLEVTEKEYKMLEPFLLGLGVRSRITKSYKKGEDWMVVIQGENPYRFWIGQNERRAAERQLNPYAISCYKQ